MSSESFRFCKRGGIQGVFGKLQILQKGRCSRCLRKTSDPAEREVFKVSSESFRFCRSGGIQGVFGKLHPTSEADALPPGFPE